MNGIIGVSNDIDDDGILKDQNKGFSLFGSPNNIEEGQTPHHQQQLLECGTSLVEDEFYNMKNDENDDNNNNNNNPINCLENIPASSPLTNTSDSRSDVVMNHQLSLSSSLYNISSSEPKSIESLRSWIFADLIQEEQSDRIITMFQSPFEKKKHYNNDTTSTMTTNTPNNYYYYTVPLIYCDHTASNRALYSIEQYINNVCIPWYGNTHTNTSRTGSQSTAFIAESRQIIAEVHNAKITGKASLDCVIFTGSGTTSAVELLIDCIGIKQNNNDNSINNNNRPIIFIGPYEHHSNLIPWRECGCEIIMIPEEGGNIDFIYLEKQLKKYNNRYKIGTFTAASNVTGIICNIHLIASLLHQYNTLCFIDCATATPYCKIDMNPTTTSSYLDAIMISPHKIIGGINTPGILIIKKHLINQYKPPNRSGGGTVFYVTSNHHRFLSNRIERYEGGTPNIIGIIRIGLIYLYKRQIESLYQKIVTVQQQEQQKQEHNHLVSSSDNIITNHKNKNIFIPKTIQEFDIATYKSIVQYLNLNAPNLILLGQNSFHSTNHNNNHLPIFSFLIRFQKRFLHYNYVCAILNDVFGIQSRGGCQCSGPYSQTLLGLTTQKTMNDKNQIPNHFNICLENALIRYKERAELLRPGYTRLSLPYKGLTTEMIDYVLQALVWVSKYGWSLMCQYRCNHRTGEWRHANRQGKPLGTKDERKWLNHYNVFHETMNDTNVSHEEIIHQRRDGESINKILQQSLKNAEEILHHAKSDHKSIVEVLKMGNADLGNDEDDDINLEELRWYVYPKECAQALVDGVSVWDPLDDTTMGAIQPNRKLEENNQVQQESNPNDETSESNCDRKRKEPYNNSEARVTDKESSSMNGEIISQNHVVEVDAARVIEMSTSFVASTKQQKKAPRDSTSWGHVASIADEKKERKQEPIKELTKCQNTKTLIQEDQLLSAKKVKKFRRVKPPSKIMRAATQAIIQWDMIQNGDKLLLGLSGGKDSLALLHCLLEFQRILPIKFEIEVCTIDPMTPSFDPSPLIPYVESFGLKYHYMKDNIVERANASGKQGNIVSSLCAFCARMKRGNLYTCARQNNCNKLVLAQHLDDCAESFMMSVMHNGTLRTMKANYSIDAGDLSVIRPLIYCRESLMTDFAKSQQLPVINENCPACFEEPKERARIKKMLNREEAMHPNFYDSMRRSLIPLMHDDLSPILRAYTEEVVSRSRSKQHRVKSDAVPKSQNGSSPHPHNSTTTQHNLTPVDIIKSNNDNGIVAAAPTMHGSEGQLKNFTDDELILELARRKGDRFRQPKSTSDGIDPTGQICTLNGGNGTIPCRELME